MELALEGTVCPEAGTEWITQLYEDYSPRFHRTALAIVRDPRLAEEAVQETWLKVVRLAECAERQDIERQLFSILKNTALDILRKERRYLPLPEQWEKSEGGGEPDGELVDQIARLIRALPEHYRLVLEMKYLGECSNREIAQRLGVGESTVSTRVQRGRALLIKSLKREGYLDDKEF